MIATEPLTAEQWAEIGLDDRPTFADDRYMVIYGQRTEDGRLRSVAVDPVSVGVGYRSESSAGRLARPCRRRSVRTLPSTRGIGITHRWGGVLAIRVTGPRSCITTPTVGSLLPEVTSAKASPLQTLPAARWLN